MVSRDNAPKRFSVRSPWKNYVKMIQDFFNDHRKMFSHGCAIIFYVLKGLKPAFLCFYTKVMKNPDVEAFFKQ